MNIETDGTITPQEAVEKSSNILIDYFSILTNNQAPADFAEPATLEAREDSVKPEVE